MFFFTGYEYYNQRLDTGILQSWVPTDGDAQRRFQRARRRSRASATAIVSTVPTNLVNGRVPASQIDPNGQALLRLFPMPNADPALDRRLQLRRQNVELDQNMHQWLTRVDVNVSDNTRMFARYNLQTEEQNFPVGLWWRNGNQVPYPTEVTAPNRSHSSTVEPDARLRPDADVGNDVRERPTSTSRTSSATRARSRAPRLATPPGHLATAASTRFRR